LSGLVGVLFSAGCGAFQGRVLSSPPPRELPAVLCNEARSLPPMLEIPEPQTTNSVEAREIIGGD